MKICAVKNSVLLLRRIRRGNGAVKTSELRSSVAKESKEKNVRKQSPFWGVGKYKGKVTDGAWTEI